MGKHHWKVEKQPEWYVKAVRKTIAALPGGYAEAAEWLDVTENDLFNRLRADGDQIFPLGWAMILQRAAGTHYIADAVAQSAGGVFVSLPEIEEVENADINQRLLEVIKYAVIVVSTLPVMCIYPFLQKYFVQGVMIGSLKG